MSKARKITYWLATAVLASGLMASGIQQLLRVEGVGALAPPYAWGHCAIGLPCLCIDHTRHMETPRRYSDTHPKVPATQGMGICRYVLPAHRSTVLAYHVRP